MAAMKAPSPATKNPMTNSSIADVAETLRRRRAAGSSQTPATPSSSVEPPLKKSRTVETQTDRIDQYNWSEASVENWQVTVPALVAPPQHQATWPAAVVKGETDDEPMPPYEGGDLIAQYEEVDWTFGAETEEKVKVKGMTGVELSEDE